MAYGLGCCLTVLLNRAPAAAHTFEHRTRPRCVRRCLARCFGPVARHARQRSGEARIQRPGLLGTSLWRGAARPRWPPATPWRWGLGLGAEEGWALRTPEHFANMPLLSQPLLSHNCMDKPSKLLGPKEKLRIQSIAQLCFAPKKLTNLRFRSCRLPPEKPTGWQPKWF